LGAGEKAGQVCDQGPARSFVLAPALQVVDHFRGDGFAQGGGNALLLGRLVDETLSPERPGPGQIVGNLVHRAVHQFRVILPPH